MFKVKLADADRRFFIARFIAGLFGTIVANTSIVFAVVAIARYVTRTDA